MTKILLDNVSFKIAKRNYKSNTFKDLFLNNFSNKNHIEYQQILSNISLTINEGDRVGIIGNNGCGKTTLLKILAGIYYPTSGEINIDGNISVLLETGVGFDPELTGSENIFFNSAIMGHSNNNIKNVYNKIIEMSGLINHIDKQFKYYSTGMALRLAFATLINLKSDILVLDELFVGGDINFVSQSKKLIEKKISDSKIFIAVSHDLSLLSDMCNKFIWIENGMIVDIGSKKIITDYKTNCNEKNC